MAEITSEDIQQALCEIDGKDWERYEIRVKYKVETNRILQALRIARRNSKKRKNNG